MNQKYKTIIAIVLFLWVFALGWIIGEDKGIGDTLATAIQTTQAPLTTPQRPENPINGGTDANTTTANSGSNDADTTTANSGGAAQPDNNGGASSDQGNTAANDPTTYSKDQIIQMMNYYVNLVKTEQNMTATKNEVITVNLKKLSADGLRDMVQDIINGLVGDGGETVTYSFNGGVDASGATPFSLIPPTDKEFKLSAEGVAEAKVEKSGENYVYTVVLVAEDTTLQNPAPFYNSTAIGYLDLAGLDIPAAKITKADMHYPASIVSVTVDSQDRVIELVNKLPMTGTGEASLAFLSGSAEFDGSLNESWTFSY